MATATVPITSSLPRSRILGIKDDSIRPIVLEPQQLPIHFPLWFLYTEWGPHDELIATGNDGAGVLFGDKTFEERSKFFTHQTLFAKQSFSNANIGYVRRMVPADASYARLRLSLEIIETELTEYERADDKTYLLDLSNQRIPTGDKVTGIWGKWHISPIEFINDEDDFGSGAIVQGDMLSSLRYDETGKVIVDGLGNPIPLQTSEDGISRIYPILDFEMRFKGEKGNNLGIRIQAPTTLSQEPQDEDLVNQLGAFIYRIYFTQREDSKSTATILKTLSGEQYVPFTFKPNTVDTATELSYGIEEILFENYESKNPEEFTGYGPFKRLHVYHNNLNIVQNAIFTFEEGRETITTDTTPLETLNIFTATAASGIPYYGFQVATPEDGGLLFTENTTYYPFNGSDGTMNEAAFDELVRAELNAWESGPIDYMDYAKNPFSTAYDSGFTLATKKAFSNVLRRRDCWINIVTQDALEPINTPSEDSSVILALRTHFRLTPESTYYGTPTTRVVIFGNAGYRPDVRFYKRPISFAYKWVEKISQYAGAENGYMKSAYSFDSAPGNIVTGFIEHNAKFKSEIVRNRDWNNGLIYAENFDTRSIFWPAIQTIYSNNTSILTSAFNMIIACNLMRIGVYAWRYHVGDSKTPNVEYAEKINKFITKLTDGRYDGRVDVVPNTYYTPADEQRGYSYHTDIYMRGQGIKTVQTLSVIAERRPTVTEA